MDSFEKKRIANEKRLKSIKEWQKNRQKIVKTSSENLGVKNGVIQNKKKVYHSDDETTDKDNHLKLFDSDEDNEEPEDFGDCFKIRPQFEGRNGQRMLEMSSELSDRFKLDERFREEEESIKDENFEDSEKDKNIRILESILGHEVSKKHPIAQNAKRKREIERFDPENENDVSCIKDVEENVPKKPKAKKRKSEPEAPPEEIPVSTERYIEVTSNLKDIMNSTGTFSFSEKFNVIVDSKKDKRSEDKSIISESSILQKHPAQNGVALNKDSNKIQTNNFGFNSSFKDPFFISNSDDRLKEGVEFFTRPKPMDQIRDEWTKKRNRILDIFKKRRKSALRGFTKQPKKQSQRNKVSSKK